MLSFLVALCHAGDPEVPWTRLAPTALSLSVPLSPEAQQALADRDHTAAVAALQKMPKAEIPGNSLADYEFLLAWSLQRAGRTSEAVPMVDAVRQAQNAPPAYVEMLVGELMMADGKYREAAEVLEKVDSGAVWVRARLALAEAYNRLERSADARAIYTELAARSDPSPGSATALYMLAQRSAPSEAVDYTRRLYRYYPGSGEEKGAPLASPTLADLAARGDTLQEKGDYSGAISLLSSRLAEVGGKDAAGCQYRYAYGRAQQKSSNLTTAVEILGPIGKSCKGIDEDRAAKALYLAGKSQERKKEWASAASYYRLIPELYPDHSMADDGYTLGGIALQEAGDLAGARTLWSKGLKAYPRGDLAAETAWRLAWGAALAGDITEAIRQADEGRDQVESRYDMTHWLASAYWAGRWRAWPTSDKNFSEERKKEAADLLEAVAMQAPWHYYGALAWARLNALDSSRAAAIKRPVQDPDSDPWQVRDAWMAEPAVRNALGLVRVGLLGDALGEFSTLEEEDLSGSEMAIITGVQARAGRFLFAHDRLRGWLKTHPPEGLGPNRYKVLRQAYPEKYWEEVKKAADPYEYEPRVFLALVREESNFNPEIKSHAGACGLSQLMPATASSVAKRAGISYSSSRIWDPQTNLNIGAYYLDMLHDRYQGNSALSLAGYNAGEGNADRWLAAMPDAPTDAVVESITFRETRFYVKRVLSTYLTYRLLYEEGPPTPDWSKWMYDAVPSSG